MVLSGFIESVIGTTIRDEWIYPPVPSNYNWVILQLLNSLPEGTLNGNLM